MLQEILYRGIPLWYLPDIITKMNTRIKVLLFICIGIVVGAWAAQSVLAADSCTTDVCWYNEAWKYRQSITIQGGQVQGDHEDFPVSIVIDDPGHPVFKQASAGGGDIVVTSGNGVTKLSHEIEYYNADTGKVALWVKVPRLQTGQDVQLFLYYGNPSASVEQKGSEVWSNGFNAVWHMATDLTRQSPAESVQSLQAAAQGISERVEGRVGYSHYFPGDMTPRNSTIEVADHASLDVTNNFTVSVWVYNEDSNPSDNRILSKKSSWNSSTGWEITLDEDESTFIGEQRHKGGLILLGSASNSSGDLDFPDCVDSWTGQDSQRWVYVAFTVTGTTATTYCNGNTGDSGSWNALAANTLPLKIGASTENVSDSAWKGRLDEIRISSVVRSADWLATEYKNQNNPSAFYALGTIEEYGKEVATPTPTTSAKQSASQLKTLKTKKLIVNINNLFRLTHHREITVAEWKYWMSRITKKEKTTLPALFGAMQFHYLTEK